MRRYYNNISSLEELHRLRHNTRLQELDLRLNPVARNEPDYRLFLIHMLPNLRRLGQCHMTMLLTLLHARSVTLPGQLLYY